MARLEPLKTLHEARSTDQFVEAFVVEIPAKLTSKALKIVKPIIPNNRFMSFHHLRRLCTLSHLPIDLTWRRDYDSNGLDTVFLLLPSTVASWQTICATLKLHIEVEGLPRCFNAVVPRAAPLSAEQARLWSERYWPCIYNPASQVLQDAPPLNTLRRMQIELDIPTTDDYMQLARKVADQARDSGIGKATGAVIVNPENHQIVAVAGDGRWWTNEKAGLIASDSENSAGRAEYHSLMRAIAMVANKELNRRLQAGLHTKFASTCTESPAGRPLTAIEKAYLDPFGAAKAGDEEALENLSALISNSLTLQPSNPRPDGYLCSGLDVYLTHEPCVCCAMAMIHSRFRTCVFQSKMPRTGSLFAEKSQGIAYGLFWRRELNWRVMTFQYRMTEVHKDSAQQDCGFFHA